MKLVCHGCGVEAPATDPFRCANAGDDVDHLIERHLDGEGFETTESDNPFLRFGPRMFARSLAPEIYDEVVAELDDRITEVDGVGFRVTPLRHCDGVGAWVKDETGNVSGSHKARHLMGLMVYLEVTRRAGILDRRDQPLAISSCGNAALAAAVVAAAARWPLQVYVPTWADGPVIDRLSELGAIVNRCARIEGQTGDPCTLAFRAAVADGAIPFSCQGSDAGLAVEGGVTLGYELVEQLGDTALDHLVIQVGGGALASAVNQAFVEADALGAIAKLPKLHAVQTEGAAPLARAYERLVADGGDVDAAAKQRSRYMWPWESEPHSLAHGILDDETYDWLAIVRGLLASGGRPVVVGEDRVEEALRLGASATGIEVSATGTAGLAGLLELRAQGHIEPGESAAVLFTGVKR